MASTYILKSQKNGKYYVGSTNRDVQERLEDHNSGRVAYTKNLRPWILVVNQWYDTVDEARHVERKLKSFKSKKIIEKIVDDGYIKLRTHSSVG